MARQSNCRRKARSECIGSDQSDEDYIIDENECDESEDEYSSFIDDESEESICAYEDEEEDKETRSERKKLRNTVRQRASRTNKKRVVRPRKRKRVSYREDDVEEEEEDDDDDDDEDEDFKPDEVFGVHEEEAEFPITIGNKNFRRPGVQSVISEVVEDDDIEYVPDEVDCTDAEEDEQPRTKSKSGKFRLRKFIANVEEEDGSGGGGYDDDEFGINEMDGADDEEDVFPVVKSRKKLRKRMLHKGIAKDGDDDDDDDEFKPDELGEADDENDEEEIPMTSWGEKVNGVQLQRCLSEGAEYDDDDDHNNDNYFTPVVVDHLDEEDECSTMKGCRKLRSTCMFQGIDKGKPSKITRGETINKDVINRGDPVDKDVKLNDVCAAEEKNKISIEGEKIKRLIVHSDSSSANNGLLDWRCPVIPKNFMEPESSQLQKKHSRRKGKEKVEDWKPEVGKQVCGICLSEEGKRRVRGTLNCCNHYFCFACIMEWSKVESRCPLCKQRFVTISKPAKPNACLDLMTEVIQVTERDQVYQPSEEELRGYLDPYENVICTECQQGGDDAVMLLCDLCDSSAHTYCVGLGREVPEGNWYCEGCRPTALGSANQQNLNLPSENRTNNFSVISPPPVADVRQTFDLNEMYIPETPLNQETFNVPSPGTALPAAGTAVTVSDRRRIQRQIHLILNDRMRQVDDYRTTGITTDVTENYLFGSQIRGLDPRPHFSFLSGRRLQDNISVLLHSRNAFAAASGHFNGQSVQNQPFTSVQGSFNGFLQEGDFGAVNQGNSSSLVNPQLLPCSGRPNTVPNASTSDYQFREATMPSWSLHGGGYTHQFS
ncbi:unnamed protein product [Cuscuta campestris]|uniref:PHD-type domain-containing protein n=1 Tax=Cuscuta campestris TaxID=132261 RepID=A0A484LB71_9ASTE|nr:unnamed protein product [Cuscuta campestris]